MHPMSRIEQGILDMMFDIASCLLYAPTALLKPAPGDPFGLPN